MVPDHCMNRSWDKNTFRKCNFEKSSCLKPQGPVRSYLVCNIIWRSSSIFVSNYAPWPWSKLSSPQGCLMSLFLLFKTRLCINEFTVYNFLCLVQPAAITKFSYLLEWRLGLVDLPGSLHSTLFKPDYISIRWLNSPIWA